MVSGNKQIDYAHIAHLMCLSVSQVVTPYIQRWLDEKHPHFKIESKVGSGKATNCRVFRRQNFALLTFGKKMVESKSLSRRHAANWTTGGEILNKGYYGGDLTLKKVITHTVIHEFAHIIQILGEGRERGKMHTPYFFKVMDRMYQAKVHELIFNFLDEYKDFKELDFISDEDADQFNKQVQELVLEYDGKMLELAGEQIACKKLAGKQVVVCMKDNYGYYYFEEMYLEQANKKRAICSIPSSVRMEYSVPYDKIYIYKKDQ